MTIEKYSPVRSLKKMGKRKDDFGSREASHKMKTYPKEYFYKKIVLAKLYIDSHYAESINVQDIADEALFSKFDFIRQFKKTFGKTPYGYLKYVRLNRATELLASYNLSVKEVCYEIGYGSVSSFCGLFKREFGISPRNFQKECHERNRLVKAKPLHFVPGCFADRNGWKKRNFEEFK